MQAAIESVRDDGYGATTVDRIAARAGVGKQTLYRWWPSKADVVLEALLEDAARFVAPEPSDDARDDLLRFLIETFARLEVIGPIVRGLMAHAQHDAAFRAIFRDRFLARRRAALRDLIVAAKPQARDVDVRVDCLYGAMWYRLLDEHGPLDKRFAEALVAFVVS